MGSLTKLHSNYLKFNQVAVPRFPGENKTGFFISKR
jgi:hypothetical protein